MSDTFLKVIILGLPLGFSLAWFVYWVAKIYKARQQLEKRRGGSREAGVSPPSAGARP